MRRLLLTIVAFTAAALLVWTVEPLRVALGHAIHGDVGPQAQLQALGVTGALILVALILVHAVVLLPGGDRQRHRRPGLRVRGGDAARPGGLDGLRADRVLAGVVAGRPLAVRMAGEERVAVAERLIDRGGAPALLLARLIPFVPFSLTGYVAGAARVPLWRYTWTSCVGVAPITAAAVYLGHALDDLSALDPLLWAAIAVFVLLGVLTVISARRCVGLVDRLDPSRQLDPVHARAFERPRDGAGRRAKRREDDVPRADVLVAAGERDLQGALEGELRRGAELRALRERAEMDGVRGHPDGSEAARDLGGERGIEAVEVQAALVQDPRDVRLTRGDGE